jgi:hypothetical protein
MTMNLSTRARAASGLVLHFVASVAILSAGPASLVPPELVPLRYSRTKMERRAADYGSHKSPPVLDMTPEQWVAEQKRTAGAPRGYRYVEDGAP